MKNIFRVLLTVVMLGLIFPITTVSAVNNSPLEIISPEFLPSGVVGKPYTYQFKAKGGQGPYTWDLSSHQNLNFYHCCLIGLNSKGKFSSVGTGDSQMPYSGNYHIGVKVTDKNGQSVEKVFQYYIASPDSISTKYKLGKIESISNTNISGWAYDNGRAVNVQLEIQEVGNKKRSKTYKFKTTPNIMRSDAGQFISDYFRIGGIMSPVGFSIDPSSKITKPGTYRIKSIKYNKNKFEYEVDSKTTFTIQ